MSQHPQPKSQNMRRSVRIDGHGTSSVLEGAFWNALQGVAAYEGIKVGRLLSRIESDRRNAIMSSSVRLYLLNHYRRLSEDGLTVKQKR
jgi:predicted DNA-binding ribbon-helix-helix protein